MYCTGCGSKLVENAKFCSKCGKSCVDGISNNSQNINNQATNLNKENNGLALASLIIGAASLIFISLAPLTLISSIVGLILGIANKNKCKEKTIGIILNIISIVITLLLTIFLVILFLGVGDSLKDTIEATEEKIKQETVFGVWNCKENNYNDFGYTITLHLNEDGTFEWDDYNDEINNHIYGEYSYHVFDRESFNDTISYKLYFESNEYVKDGEALEEIFNKQYTMVIDIEDVEATLKSMYGTERYLCDYKIGSISEM